MFVASYLYISNIFCFILLFTLLICSYIRAAILCSSFLSSRSQSGSVPYLTFRFSSTRIFSAECLLFRLRSEHIFGYHLFRHQNIAIRLFADLAIAYVMIGLFFVSVEKLK